MTEYANWIKTIRSPNPKSHPCEFSEYGLSQPPNCWYYPSPETCKICLMGKQADALILISESLTKLEKLIGGEK